MTIDYEKILRAYIKHVQFCEGTDFLYGSHGYPNDITGGELEALIVLHNAVHIELENEDA